KIQVGVISSAPRSTSMMESLKRDSTLVLRTYDDSSGARALRTGKVALLVVPTARPDSVRYVYDRGRSDAANARIVVDHAVQSGAGRADPVRATDTYVTEKGSRYIDFLIPGLLGMNLMGSSIWGLGFAIVTARSKKLLKRLMATPMWIFSGVFFSSANFPSVVQPFIRLLPLTAVNDALRANMLEGASFAAVSPQMIIILIWGVVTFFAALRLFRWR